MILIGDNVTARQGPDMAANDSAYVSSPTTLTSQSAGSSGKSKIAYTIGNR